MDKVFLVWFFCASAICGATMVGTAIGMAAHLACKAHALDRLAGRRND